MNNKNNTNDTKIITVSTPNAKYRKIKKIIYYVLGVLETLLVFRFVLKLLGANPISTFVSIIYSITSVLLAPFIGIFRTAVTEGIETKSILEPANLIGMIVYALIAYGIVKLVRIYLIPKVNDKKSL